MRAAMLAAAMAGMAWGAAPPARPQWRETEARLAAEEARARAGRTPAQQGKLDEARRLEQQALRLHRDGDPRAALGPAARSLALRVEILKEKHPESAKALHNLAAFHEAAGRHREALPLFEKALAARLAIYGESHPACAVTLLSLGGVHHSLGDHARGLAALREGVRIARDVFGPRHPSYATGLNNLASLLQDMGRHQDALRLYEQQGRIVRETLGDRHPAYANSLNNLGVLFQAMGDLARALPPLREAVRLTRESLGERHPSHAGRLHNLASLLNEMGDRKEALALARRALKIQEATLGKRHPEYASSLNLVALVLVQAGDRDAGLPLARQAVELRAEALGKKHPGYAASLHNLAMALKGAGRRAEALPLLREASRITDAALGAGHPHSSESAHALAGLLAETGDHQGALALYRRTLAAREKALGKRHPSYATSLNNLALLHKELGDHAAALPLALEAAERTKAVTGERHHEYAACLHNLALLRQAMGRDDLAMPLLRRSLAINKEALGEGHPEYANGLNSLGSLLQAMGDRAGALPLLRQALAIRKQALGDKHPAYANSLVNLAALHQAMGKLDDALPLLHEALALRQAGLSDAALAGSLNNLASLHHARRDHELALPLQRRAVALSLKALGEDHPDHARHVLNLAAILSSLDRHGEALLAFQEAARLAGKAFAPKHPSYATALAGLAGQHHRLGRPSAALPLQEECLALTRHHLASNASVLSARQQFQAMASLRHRLGNRLTLPDEAARFSHGHALAWKGSVFAGEQARRLFVKAAADPATRAIASEVLDDTRALALLSSRTDPESRRRAEELIGLRERKEARLAERSADFRAAHAPPSSEQLRALLPPGAVLVDLVAYEGLDPALPARGQEWQRRLAAWVLRADAPSVRVGLGPILPIEEAVSSWRGTLERGVDPGDTPAQLRALAWTPLAKHMEGAKAVLISPDGALGRLPWVALPGSTPGSFLVEEVPLSILPIPQALPRLLAKGDRSASLLAVGGAEYGAGDRWIPLPATGPEADAIASRFRASFKGGVSSLSGTRATKAALREALPRHSFAHLATHGFFAPAHMASALDRAAGRGFDPLGEEGVAGWHPGLLSGLVLAGANRPTDLDDGILTASEIAETDLSGLDLAVLSACQTGLGKEAAGEGMMGLQRAFAVAGCRSVVSSLWSVHDAATAVLMERFYHHLWKEKRTKLEALRQAQLDVLRHPEWVEARAAKLAGTRGLRGVGKATEKVPGKAERRSPPAWWAAWQLSGDWR